LALASRLGIGAVGTFGSCAILSIYSFAGKRRMIEILKKLN